MFKTIWILSNARQAGRATWFHYCCRDVGNVGKEGNCPASFWQISWPYLNQRGQISIEFLLSELLKEFWLELQMTFSNSIITGFFSAPSCSWIISVLVGWYQMYLFKSSVVWELTRAVFDNLCPKSILDKSQFRMTMSKKSEVK